MWKRRDADSRHIGERHCEAKIILTSVNTQLDKQLVSTTLSEHLVKFSMFSQL